MHERTKYRLHSHDVPYGSGSGQQSVTGFGGVQDANSYWVRSPHFHCMFGCVFDDLVRYYMGFVAFQSRRKLFELHL